MYLVDFDDLGVNFYVFWDAEARPISHGLKNGFFVSVRTSATGKRTSAECEMDKKYSVRIFLTFASICVE